MTTFDETEELRWRGPDKNPWATTTMGTIACHVEIPTTEVIELAHRSMRDGSVQMLSTATVFVGTR